VAEKELEAKKLHIKEHIRKQTYALVGIPKGWYKLAELKDISPGQIKEVIALEKVFAVYRSQDGSKVSVMNGFCPHMGAEFAMGGRVVGNCIECPFHSIQFGHDGMY